MKHREQADKLEREVSDMETKSERLGDQIDETREDWEHKKRDPSVPGADGALPEPGAGPQTGPPAEETEES